MAVRDGNETTIPKAGVKPEDTKEGIPYFCNASARGHPLLMRYKSKGTVFRVFYEMFTGK